MFTPDEYYNIVEFTGAGTRRDEVVEEIQQQPNIDYRRSEFRFLPARKKQNICFVSKTSCYLCHNLILIHMR